MPLDYRFDSILNPDELVVHYLAGWARSHEEAPINQPAENPGNNYKAAQTTKWPQALDGLHPSFRTLSTKLVMFYVVCEPFWVQ